MRKNGFHVREFHGIRYYSCIALEQIANLRHGFSTRAGGLSVSGKSSFNLGYTSWDSIERVNENRRRFLSALDLENSFLATLLQVHSDRVFIIEHICGEWNRSEGDALATAVPGVALAVQVADCIPILIADPMNHAAAAVHSGWRGTLARVLDHTLAEMHTAFGSSPSNLVVAVGPGIRACCFEVGSEVAGLFEKGYPGAGLTAPAEGRPSKRFLDLYKAIDIQLDQAGVPESNRYDAYACSRCRPDEFFSYRAEGQDAGRMMAAIGFMQ